MNGNKAFERIHKLAFVTFQLETQHNRTCPKPLVNVMATMDGVFLSFVSRFCWFFFLPPTKVLDNDINIIPPLLSQTCWAALIGILYGITMADSQAKTEIQALRGCVWHKQCLFLGNKLTFICMQGPEGEERRDRRKIRELNCVRPETPLTTALSLLLDAGVSTLPIVNQVRLHVLIITDI